MYVWVMHERRGKRSKIKEESNVKKETRSKKETRKDDKYGKEGRMKMRREGGFVVACSVFNVILGTLCCTIFSFFGVILLVCIYHISDNVKHIIFFIIFIQIS
jgi:hypothetical protein